ncbi:putative RNA-binding protein with TRAM domain [Halarchaeum rubridurum]|uniref:Putative RNA-binding protein with TRAM domain n=1 Tax=Halarchaeum rubridurum TaxID=489911 RepID=A0A830G1U9_9EURY|nr:hypothetical protein [Halarchaeum rubridurum]MBP1955287.1 putative RNA-binding protein with TRAM domain [Halarchaeum rubridurum]GGM71042.1 hypothetical protein GCM10009017_21430 [Halarchaeum rubridurum]
MNWTKLTAGWSFRTSTPSFAEGEEFAVFVTDAEGGVRARVGDTVLTVHGAPDGVREGTKIAVRVSDFDESSHTGDVDYLRTVGESTY